MLVQSVAKNTAFMTIASVLQKVISFIYFTIVARSVGIEGTGKYFFALSFTTIFVVLTDLGLTNVLIRESAKISHKLSSYLSVTLGMKLLLGVTSYIAAVVVIHILGYPYETRLLVYVSGITMLFDSFHLTLYGVCRSLGNLKYEAIGMVGSQLLTFILGSVFIWFGFPLIFLMIAFLIPSVLNALYAAIVLYIRFKIKLGISYEREVVHYIVPIVVPFALAAVFGRIYSYIDSVLLSKLAGDIEVGIYSIPYKVAYAFQFIPVALVAALYPRFSEHFNYNKARLQQIFQYGIKYLLLISMPIVVGICVLAQDIVLKVFTSEYSASIIPLQILMVGIIFSYLNFLFGSLMNACDRQKTQTILIGVVMLLNIGVNILLIPRFGAIGAAIAAAGGNIIMSLLSMLIIPQITIVSGRFVFTMVLQLCVAAGVMGIVVWYTNEYSNFVVAIGAGALIYWVMLFLTRAVTRQQVIELTNLVRK